MNDSNWVPRAIPLSLSADDRRWLRDQALALEVRSSDVAGFLVRAARLSGLDAQSAGHALVDIGKRAVVLDQEWEETNEIFQEPVRQVPRQEPRRQSQQRLDRFKGQYGNQAEALEKYSESLAASEPDLPPAPTSLPVQPQAFQGRHGSRPDIVQLRPIGSATRPAGANGSLTAKGEDPHDYLNNIRRANYRHLLDG